MSKLKIIFYAIFGIVLALIIGYIFFLIANKIIFFIISMDSEIAVAIIAASVTALVSIVTIIISKIFEARTRVQIDNRIKKVPIYEKLINFMSRVLLGSKINKAPSESEILTFMMDFTQEIMVWGSDDVISSWVKFRRIVLNEAQIKNEPLKSMFIYEELVKSIRKDLGHKNKGIEKGDILALFVNDIDKYLPPRST
jgi:hypothetical protein